MKISLRMAQVLSLMLILSPFPSALAKDRSAERPRISAKLKSRLKASKKKVNLKAWRKIAKKNKKTGEVKLTYAKGQTATLMPLSVMRADPKQREMSDAMRLPARIKKYADYLEGKSGGSVPPAKASLKSKMTKVKNQKSRGTCVAFASVAALEYAYGTKALKKGEDLSEQDAYYVMKQAEGSGETHCDNGLVTYRAAGYLTDHAIARDKYWRYQSTEKMGCPVSARDDLRPAKAKSNAHYRIKSSKLIFRDSELTKDEGMSINNPKYLEAILAAGYPVVLSTHVAGWTKLRSVIDVQLDERGEPLEFDGGHAMLLVGYNRKKQYFIFKNSWGSWAGYGGYLRLSYDYLRTYAKFGYYITEVQPLNSKKKSECRVDTSCDAGHYCTTGIAGLGKGKCKAKRSNGKVCTSWRQCKSGRCSVGFCRKPKK